MHMMTQEWDPSVPTVLNLSTVYYYYFDGSDWDSDRAQITGSVLESGDQSATDVNFVVDADDYVHAVYEVHDHPDTSTASQIAYKWQGSESWDSPTAEPDYLEFGASGTTPRIALETRTSGDDILHLVWRSSEGMQYSSKVLGETPSSWTAPVVATIQVSPNGVGGALFAEPDSGGLHFFKTTRVNNAGGPDVDSLFVQHVYGSTAQWARTTADSVSIHVLDRWEVDNFVGKFGEEAEAGVFASSGGPTVLHVGWRRFDEEQEEWLVQYNQFTDLSTSDTATLYTSPASQTLSQLDGFDAATDISITSASNGTVHVLWEELPPASTSLKGDFYHRWSATPATASSWSPLSRVAPESRTNIGQPQILAIADTLLFAWSSGDEEDLTDDRNQIWFRKGYPLGYDAVGAGLTKTWSGVVFLDEDFTVPATSKLVIDPGTYVVAADSAYRTNTGIDADRVELIVDEGVLEAIGTEALPVVLMGTSPDPDSARGEWLGPRFLLPSASTAYGYAAAAPYSKLHHVEVRDAMVGVQIEDVIAPELDHVSFGNVDTSVAGFAREVYVDSVDVLIPFGIKESGQPIDFTPMEWDLDAPVTIVMANGSTSDLPYGETGKSDLWLGGIWRGGNATGPGPAFITVRPETRNDSTADDWGGVKVLPYGVMDLRYLDVGHAATPLFFETADSSFVRQSVIHHYADIGLHIVGGEDSLGVTVDGNLFLRGDGTNNFVGDWAIVAQDVYSARIVNNDIYDHDTGWGTPGDDGGGIWLVAGKNHCLASPTISDSIVVSGNNIVGPGESFGNARTGLALEWACGASGRPFRVDGNAVILWPTGVRLDESRDVQLKCNLIKDNATGVDWYRATSSNPEVALRENLIEGSQFRAVRTLSDIGKLALGASGTLPADRGLNRIVIDDGSLDHYITQNAASGALHAEVNQWLDLEEGSPETDEGDIRLKSDSEADPSYTNLIAADGPETSTITACWPAVPDSTPPEGGPALGALPAGGSESAPAQDVPVGSAFDPEETGSPLLVPGPSRTGIDQVRPNPSRGSFEIVLGVVAEDAGQSQVDIYDVTGRRVRTLWHGSFEPGWRTILWDGRDGSGRATASGIYFVQFRLEHGKFTKKLVRVNR
jgi:hypothetical protein